MKIFILKVKVCRVNVCFFFFCWYKWFWIVYLVFVVDFDCDFDLFIFEFCVDEVVVFLGGVGLE